MGEETIEQAVRMVAALLAGWEDSGESDLSAGIRIVRLVVQELLPDGATELEQLDGQILRLFPDIEQRRD